MYPRRDLRRGHLKGRVVYTRDGHPCIECDSALLVLSRSSAKPITRLLDESLPADRIVRRVESGHCECMVASSVLEASHHEGGVMVRMCTVMQSHDAESVRLRSTTFLQGSLG
jgi:hypothetical protein